MSHDALPTLLLPQRALHTRRGATLLAAGTTFPFTAALSVSFPSPGHVAFVVTGLAAPVAIDVTGSLGGVGDTETVTVSDTGSGVGRTAKRWDALTQLRVDETQTGSVQATARTLGGEPILLTTTLNSALPIRVRVSRMVAPMTEPSGRQIVERFVGYVQIADIAFGDQLTVDGITYEVEHALVMYGRTQRHHTELRLRRISN